MARFDIHLNPASELRDVVGSAREQALEIETGLDMLLRGY